MSALAAYADGVEEDQEQLRFVSIRVSPEFRQQLVDEAKANRRNLQNEVIEMLQESLRRRQRARVRSAEKIPA